MSLKLLRFTLKEDTNTNQAGVLGKKQPIERERWEAGRKELEAEHGPQLK
jgi:hypothetical protein